MSQWRFRPALSVGGVSLPLEMPGRPTLAAAWALIRYQTPNEFGIALLMAFFASMWAQGSGIEFGFPEIRASTPPNFQIWFVVDLRASDSEAEAELYIYSKMHAASAYKPPNFILGLGKSGQLSMREPRGLSINGLRYIFHLLFYAAGGFHPAQGVSQLSSAHNIICAQFLPFSPK